MILLSDFCGRSNRCFGHTSQGVLATSGAHRPLVRVCRMSMDASFHSGSYDTIRGCVQFRQPDISRFSHQHFVFLLLNRFMPLKGTVARDGLFSKAVLSYL